MNLSCGFLVFLFDFNIGIILIIAGAIFDVFDGAVARLLNAQSEFGKQLDSLADLITFGAAPAFLMSQLLDPPYQYLTVIIPVAAAVRLAKFNLSGDETYWFSGMPTPASAFLYLGIAIASIKDMLIYPELLSIAIILISILNISKLKMFSFKGLKKDRLTTPFLILCLVTALITSIYLPYFALLSGMITYLVLTVIYNFTVKRYTK